LRFPSCLRVSREFEEHVSEPANDRRDAARRDGRGIRANALFFYFRFVKAAALVPESLPNTEPEVSPVPPG